MIKKVNWFFIISMVLALGLLWPLFAAPYFTHHDDVQIIRLFEMWKCFKDGQIPCRWVPDLGGGFGYPIFNYYGPLAYYFGGLVYLLTMSLTFAAKSMFAVGFLVSFFGMYLLGRKLWGNWGALICSIFYVTIPYHSSVFYVRGAMGELWAMALYPFVLWALLRLRENRNLFNSLLLGTFVGLLITAHNLSTLIFIPTLIIFCWFFCKEQFKSLLFWQRILFAAAIALLLSAFYWLPMIAEKSLVHVDTTTYGYFSYTEHFKGLKKLFFDFSWGWGDSVREFPGGPRDGMSFQIGIVHWLTWLICLGLAFIYRRRYPEKSKLVFVCSGIILIAIFMIHPRSEFIWQLIPPLKYMQFPWRFLGLIAFYLCTLSGFIVPALAPLKKRSLLIIALLTITYLYNFHFFRPKTFLYLSDQEFLTGDRWAAEQRRAIFDYLPIYAEAPPPGVADTPYHILTGDMRVDSYKQGTDWFSADIEVKTHSILRFSQYYFPAWQIRINSNLTRIDYKNSLGLMTVLLGEGRHHIEARLENTPIRILGNLLTLTGAGFLIVALLLAIPLTRKRLVYYKESLFR